MNFEDVDFDEILEKCATNLRTIRRPDLALEFYKKLKFVFKVEECVADVVTLGLSKLHRC